MVVGDYNAPHTPWPKGENILNLEEKLRLQLFTLLTTPTYLGNSISRDTIPDLTFTYIKRATWTNLEENSSSYHRIPSVSTSSPTLPRAIGDTILTDWVPFRSHPLPDHIPNNIQEWAPHMKEAHE